MRALIVYVGIALLCLGCGETEEESASTAIEEGADEESAGGGTPGESSEAGTESTEGAESSEGSESAEEGSESAEEGAESAEEGSESAEEGAESAEEGAESAEEGSESAEEGAESAEEGAESAEEGAESAEEGAESAEEGGESMMVPEGTWLLWTETPGCEDFDLLSTKLASAKYAVFTVASDGASEMLFYDSSYEVFRTYSFPTVGLAEAEAFEISLVESVEEPEGSGCTINRDMTLTLTLSLGAWVGSLEYSELKKGGGCFSDGCEGSMVIKTQELGSAVNPLYVEGAHPFAYENAGDGVSETGTMLFYAVPEQPYYFELDITTVGSSLQTIRGQKYIAGQGGRLWGRASELSFSACPGVYNADHWDVDINMEAGPAFGGTLEHRTATYEEDCFPLETSTLGTLTAP